MNKITSKVSKFYNELPFNYYENSVNQANSIIQRNSILSYPNLHNLWDQQSPLSCSPWLNSPYNHGFL